jgi:hypothetical protein
MHHSQAVGIRVNVRVRKLGFKVIVFEIIKNSDYYKKDLKVRM